MEVASRQLANNQHPGYGENFQSSFGEAGHLHFVSFAHKNRSNQVTPVEVSTSSLDNEGAESVSPRTQNEGSSTRRMNWKAPRWRVPYRSSATLRLNSKEEESQTLLFRDGIRSIDYVLAFEEDQSAQSADLRRRREKRVYFQRNLLAAGLQLEFEDVEDSFDQRTCFVKIHVPWRLMRRYAGLMNLKMPIKRFISVTSSNTIQKEQPPNARKEQTGQEIPNAEGGIGKIINTMKRVCMSIIKPNQTATLKDKFYVKDRELDYTSAQRSQVAWQIMTRCVYDRHDKDKMGIRRLLNNHTYLAAYPLHEGSYDQDNSGGAQQQLDRRLLYLEWAKAGCWYKQQPLWQVRSYFGDKIGLYFAWLGFYTEMLVPAAIVGLIIFLYGCLSMDSQDNIPSKEICDPKGNGNLTLCPLCDKVCQYQQLKDSCFFAKVTYLFDNPATVFFAIFMSFWATTFLELWKRRQCVIAWEWDLILEEEDQEPRPEFESSVKSFRINPVTGKKEPYLTVWDQSRRFVMSGSVVLFMVCIVVCALIGTIIYRLSAAAFLYFYGDTFLKQNAKILTSISAAMLNLVIIFLLTRFYHKLALILTNIENPRTQSEYEDSFTFKIFVFEFMNFYSSLIYIAFFKGRFYVYPGDQHARSSAFFRLKGDVCDPAGCLSELCIQLAIIMVGKQGLNNFFELLLPKLENWHRKRNHRAKTTEQTAEKKRLKRWEEDYQLQDGGRLVLFPEYLEMVLQYGFVTMFVAAFPLAPLFALINNVAEIRLDAYKMLTQIRRPLAERVANIGAWYGILQCVTYTAVVSNAFVIAYTSDFIPRMVFKVGYSHNNTLQGYIQSSLSLFNTSHYTEDMGADEKVVPPLCWYRGYRKPPGTPDQYDLSSQYWHVFAARLAFVVVFEHVVFALTGIMAYVIPDIPAEVKMQIQQERLLAKEAKFDSQKFDLNRSASEGNQSPNIHPPIVPVDCSSSQHQKILIQNSLWDKN